MGRGTAGATTAGANGHSTVTVSGASNNVTSGANSVLTETGSGNHTHLDAASQAWINGNSNTTSTGANSSVVINGSSNITDTGRLTGVTVNFAQGATQLTGRSTDFAIQGDGFFVLNQGGTAAYTRNGSFSLDRDGYLTSADGGYVQGWQADQAGVVSTNATPEKVQIPVGQVIQPVTTTTLKIGGNLPADATVGDKVNAGIDVYDSSGNAVPLRAEFKKIADQAGQHMAGRGAGHRAHPAAERGEQVATERAGVRQFERYVVVEDVDARLVRGRRRAHRRLCGRRGRKRAGKHRPPAHGATGHHGVTR